MNTPHSHLRRFTRVTALAVVVVLPLLASPSYAEVPEGWSDPKPVDGIHALLVLAGIPIALFLVITLLVMAPSLAKGERRAGTELEWFGGPGKDVDELDPTPSQTKETGGASGSW